MNEIYLDNAATTAVRPEVAEAMLPYFTSVYGNPSSLHGIGQKGKEALERARADVASSLNVEPREIYFTSGGTESNNLAIKGYAAAAMAKGRHLVTSPLEHHAALYVFQQLEKQGFEVTYLPVDRSGLVDPADFERAIREDTILVSVMLANNEIGTIEPVREIAALARERGIAVHTDAVQAVGKIPVDLQDLGVDMLSLTAHKFYGPKGVGVLYKRDQLEIRPLFEGGSQERVLRPGTENIPGAVGLAKALKLAVGELETEGPRLAGLRDRLEKGILAGLDHVTVNGHPGKRVPNLSSINFSFLEGEALLMALDVKGIAVSTASACSAGTDDPSHVLRAIGLDPVTARSTLRFSLGRNNTAGEIDYAVETVVHTVKLLRSYSPVSAAGQGAGA